MKNHKISSVYYLIGDIINLEAIQKLDCFISYDCFEEKSTLVIYLTENREIQIQFKSLDDCFSLKYFQNNVLVDSYNELYNGNLLEFFNDSTKLNILGNNICINFENGFNFRFYSRYDALNCFMLIKENIGNNDSYCYHFNTRVSISFNNDVLFKMYVNKEEYKNLNLIIA